MRYWDLFQKLSQEKRITRKYEVNPLSWKTKKSKPIAPLQIKSSSKSANDNVILVKSDQSDILIDINSEASENVPQKLLDSDLIEVGVFVLQKFTQKK